LPEATVDGRYRNYLHEAASEYRLV
jgi:hypothetical protein